MPSAHVETIQTAIEALNRRDFETALEQLTEDVTWAPFLAVVVEMHGRGTGADLSMSQRFAQLCRFRGAQVEAVESFPDADAALAAAGLTPE